jgi:hypothetical protein
MTDCAKCGHELGLGRYCTNCGHPVPGSDDAPATAPDDDGWRTGTAERPAAPASPPPASPPSAPPAPPPAWTPPPATRYPLFADEVDQPDPVDLPGEPVTHQSHRRSRPWVPWVAAAAVVAVVAVLGVRLLSGDDPESPTAQDSGASAPATGDDAPSSDGPGTGPAAGLTAGSEVTVPATAKPNQDVDGKPVDYDGANMLDGVPETCWRMPGDGSGKEIVVTLPQKTHLRSVGLINGYAKQQDDRDWYHGNRRITKVEWEFDDGRTFPQVLGDTTAVQSIDVDVTTSTITLRLVSVSKPGTGAASRDYTAISDLLFVAS